MENKQRKLIVIMEEQIDKSDATIFELEILLKEMKEDQEEFKTILMGLKSKVKNDNEEVTK